MCAPSTPLELSAGTVQCEDCTASFARRSSTARR